MPFGSAVTCPIEAFPSPPWFDRTQPSHSPGPLPRFALPRRAVQGRGRGVPTPLH